MLPQRSKSPGSQKSDLLQPKAKNHPQGQVRFLNLREPMHLVRRAKGGGFIVGQTLLSAWLHGGKCYYLYPTYTHYSFLSSLPCCMESWTTSTISLVDLEVQQFLVEETTGPTVLPQRRNLIPMATDQSYAPARIPAKITMTN